MRLGAVIRAESGSLSLFPDNGSRAQSAFESRRFAWRIPFVRAALLIAFVLFHDLPARAQMATGTYVGNGAAGRAITGLGFQPDIVLIRVDYADAVTSANAAAVMRTSTMTGDNTKVLVGLLPLTSNLIQSLQPDGFTVGNDLRVNALNLCGAGTDPCTYYWTAWKANINVLVGTYIGNGTTQSIPLSFSPDYVVSLCACGRRAVHRTRRGTNQSMNFSPGTPIPDGITSLDANGFTVQHSADINDSPNISGQTYHYIAWNEVAGRVKVGEYTGNAIDDRAITGVGFQPEYVILQSYNDSMDAFQRSDWMPAEPPDTTPSSMSFGNSATTGPALSQNRIQRFVPDGFEVGTYTGVNKNAGLCNADTTDCFYAYVAFEAHGTTNFRSIGTAPPRSSPLDGTVSATRYSVSVTGSGTQWQTWNRGRGDVITIDGTNYVVLSVESETELTLATPFTGATGSGKSYTLARQFSTLAAWEDCVDGGPCAYFPVASSSLVADKRSEVGIAYEDSVFTLSSNFVIQGSTTDALHSITLTADGVNRHYGTPGAGVIVDSNLDPNGWYFRIRDSNVTVEWLEFLGRRCTVGTCDSTATIEVNNGGSTPPTNVLLQNLLIHDFYSPTSYCPTTCPPDTLNRIDIQGIGFGGSVPGVNVTVRNTMIWDGDRDGIRGGAAGDTVVVENCSVHEMRDSAGSGGRGFNANNGTLTIRNSIATNNPNGDFAITGTGTQNGSNNTSSDATADDPPFTNGQTLVSAASIFVDPTLPNSNLHLRPDLLPGPSSPLNSGLDLSTSFWNDVDGESRLALAWDRGADERDGTTAVELVSFTARGGDGEVELTWETGSELNNLGFHLHRASSREGPYEKITVSVIPGLGSSPEGARYRYRDTGLTNGLSYYYKLEDIETTGGSKIHGPVTAVPRAGSSPVAPAPEEGMGPALITYGEPSANSFRVIERGSRQLVLELWTSGFYGEPQEDGTVRLSIPGFEPTGEGGSASIPVSRPWVDAVSGLEAELSWVRPESLEVVSGLTPSGAEVAEIVASRQGTVRAGMRPRRGRSAEAFGSGMYPEKLAGLLQVGFQGEAKKAQLELAPLRWDGARGQLVLVRRLLVGLVFRGKAFGETAESGHRGRRYPARLRHDTKGVLVRLAAAEQGLYEVAFEDIFPANRRRRPIAASELSLSRQGKAVSFHLEPEGARFQPGSRLYFWSEGGKANPYGLSAAYELSLSSGGSSMASSSAFPSGEPTGYYRKQVEREENRYYQAGLLEASDLWFWDVLISPARKAYPFEVTELVARGESSRLSVWLQGGSDLEADPDHHLRVYVNGSLVEEVSWDGKKSHALAVELLPGTLREGENLLELESVGDTGARYSMVFLDRFSVDHARDLVAEGGVVQGNWSESGTATASEVGSTAYVLDVSEQSPRWLRDLDRRTPGAVRFRAEAGRRYVVASGAGILRPELRRASGARGLKSERLGADYLVMGPREFLLDAAPLLELRRREGLRVRAVAVEDVFEEFGYGEMSPEAIHRFLAYAYHRWPGPPVRYVLLLGDASYDFKDYLGTGVVNRVPALLVKTSYLWTASDPTLAAVNGEDVLPDLAIGRLPAATREELRAMIEKTMAYEAGEASLSRARIVVADDADGAGDFVANAEEIASGALAGGNVLKLYLSELGASGLRSELIEALDRGASLISYVGHGGIHLWADENIFNTGDVHSLAPQPQQPLLVTMNCLNGYFHFPYLNSLSEEMLKAPEKGAIAAYSPSGLSLNAPAHRLQQLFLAEVFHGSHLRLGDALLAGQRAYAESGAFPELLRIYHLFGDPALRIH